MEQWFTPRTKDSRLVKVTQPCFIVLFTYISFIHIMNYFYVKVEMTEEWAKKYPKIHFSVMHPGWADTPAVRSV